MTKPPTRRMQPGILAIMLLVGLTVSACAPTGDGGTVNIVSDVRTSFSSGQSPEQRQLTQVQRDYAKTRLQGAAVGSVLAGLGAWALGANREQIVAATVAGGAVGYVGANALTRQNANFQLSRDTLAADIKTAREESSRMARSVSAAENAVKYQNSEIARLNSAHQAGSVTTAQYEAKYATMQMDLKNTRALSAESQKRLDGLNQLIGAYDQAGINHDQLVAEREEQQAAVDRLKAAEMQMVRNLSKVASAIS